MTVAQSAANNTCTALPRSVQCRCQTIDNRCRVWKYVTVSTPTLSFRQVHVFAEEPNEIAAHALEDLDPAFAADGSRAT